MRIVVVALVVLACLAPVGANASSETHCVARLEPREPLGRNTRAAIVDLGCYDTYAEALTVGSGGTMSVDPGVEPETLTEATVLAAASSDVLIGTEWDRINFAGESRSYFAPRTCSATTTWDVAYVGATWNDRFASGKGFGGCDHNRKFQHADFGGAVLLCTPNCSDYGSLTNEVSSLRWKD
jgi:hypothetical protein